MAKHKTPVTQAIRLLRKEGVAFVSHPYHYVKEGGTEQFAEEMAVDEHQVIKTLIMEDEEKMPLIVLMHGDCEVSTKSLARQIGVKPIQPYDPKVADHHSGYQVGGTLPFGTLKKMPVYCEENILKQEKIYINCGKRGYIISMNPSELVRVLLLQPTLISAAQ